MDPDELNHKEYIGDGVYAGFDGHQIWIWIDETRHRPIALEPTVMEALILYSDIIKHKIAQGRIKEILNDLPNWKCSCGKRGDEIYNEAPSELRWAGSYCEHYHGYPIGHVAMERIQDGQDA